jgi:hypothetical protein
MMHVRSGKKNGTEAGRGQHSFRIFVNHGQSDKHVVPIVKEFFKKVHPECYVISSCDYSDDYSRFQQAKENISQYDGMIFVDSDPPDPMCIFDYGYFKSFGDKPVIVLCEPNKKLSHPFSFEPIFITSQVDEVHHMTDTISSGNFINGIKLEYGRGDPSYHKYLDEYAVMISDALRSRYEGKSSTISVRPIFGPTRASYMMPEIFVLMPFSEEMRPIFVDHIKKIAGRMNLSCGRADDFFSTQAVINEVWSAISHSKVVIADCTGRNPNVFYEIGIAHAIGKPTIIITQNVEDVPFDLRHLRFIIYKYTPRGMENFEDTLKNTISSVMSS